MNGRNLIENSTNLLKSAIKNRKFKNQLIIKRNQICRKIERKLNIIENYIVYKKYRKYLSYWIITKKKDFWD
jgi:hypothetical protein